MRDIDTLLQLMGGTEPHPNGARIDADVMSSIALLPPVGRDGGLLRWGSVTAMTALAVGTMSGSVFAAPHGVSATPTPFSVGVAFAPSTLLASTR